MPRRADPAVRVALTEAAARLLGEEGPAALTTRRLAAEMTPVDIAKAIQMELPAYRELEAGRGGLTEAQVAALIKIEKMRITRKDVDHARPTILAGEDGEAAAARALMEDHLAGTETLLRGFLQ